MRKIGMKKYCLKWLLRERAEVCPFQENFYEKPG
jgi:hypothetical protein